MRSDSDLRADSDLRRNLEKELISRSDQHHAGA